MKCLALIDSGTEVFCPEGHGYWDLTQYPWGGSFHRFAKDRVCLIERIVDTYKDGAPRRVIVKMDGRQIGITL
jgi:hypothetical protein